MHRFPVRASLALAGLFASTAVALAGAPASIHYQGLLTDGGGLPLSGDYAIAFRLYADTAAAPVWAETLAVAVTDGFYEADLDVSAVSFGVPLYLGIEIGGAQLGPKKPLAAVPYALAVADSAVTLGAIDPTGASAGDVLAFTGDSLAWMGLEEGGVFDGSIRVGRGSSSDDDAVYFDSAGAESEFLEWEDNSARFYLSDDLFVEDDLEVGGELTAESLLRARGGVVTDDYLSVGGDISLGDASASNNAYLNFEGSPGLEYMEWNSDSSRFYLSSPLHVGGTIALGSAIGRNEDYNYLSNNGHPNPASGEMLSASDLFVGGSLEVGFQIYYSGLLIDLSPEPAAKRGGPEELDGQRARALLDSLDPILFPRPADGGSVKKAGFRTDRMPDLLAGPGGKGYRPLELVVVLTRIAKDLERRLDEQKAIADSERDRIDRLEERIRRLEQDE